MHNCSFFETQDSRTKKLLPLSASHPIRSAPCSHEQKTNSKGCIAMKHLTEDILQTYLDGELSVSNRTEAAAHLSTCPTCRSRLEAVSARSARAATHLSALAPTPAEASPSGHNILMKLKDKQGKEDTSMIRKLLSHRFR